MFRLFMMLCLCVVLGGVGCAGPTNPAFSVSRSEAQAALDAMAADPKPLERPLLILGGYLDTGIVRYQLERTLEGVFEDERMLGMAFAFMGDFDSCREKLLEAIADSFGEGASAGETVEVDVVAYSMGGLVARHAARSDALASTPRLKIRRLYTIATPHEGAELAWLPTDELSVDMMPASDFLETLNDEAETQPYEVVAYGRLKDWIVGVQNVGYAGRPPYWVDTPPLSLGHVSAVKDARIVADIARRLRGEAPFTDPEPAPLP